MMGVSTRIEKCAIGVLQICIRNRSVPCSIGIKTKSSDAVGKGIKEREAKPSAISLP